MKVITILSCMLFMSFNLFAQKGTRKIVRDGERKFLYSDSTGVTESYIKYFGDSLSVPDLTTFDGEVITAADRKNKTIFYNFWFVTCRPCVAEIPVLNRLADKYQNDSTLFIAITFDDKTRINEFLQNHKFTFQIATLPQDEVDKIKRTIYYPFTAILKADGKLSFALFSRPVGKNQEDELFHVLEKQMEVALGK